MNGYTLMGEKSKLYLDIANAYAKSASGCSKVSVGSAIVKNYGRPNENIVSVGANADRTNLCKHRGCLREELYGEASKEHRLPSDCRAIHSEVDAIAKAATDLSGCDLFVTRYPCEACARVIVASGIKSVWFGRGQSPSEQTEQILARGGVELHWIKEWEEDDRND